MQRIRTSSLEDYFKPLSKRKQPGVFFYRIHGFDNEIEEFLRRYCAATSGNGMIISERLPNPDEKNIAYYHEMLGDAFQMDTAFIEQNLKKWMPRLDHMRVCTIGQEMLRVLVELKNRGKSESILKNCYIKFMCWLYYKFSNIVNQLGNEAVPKIIYDGDISLHELMFLSMLSGAGCDIVLLLRNGEVSYRKYDAASQLSDELPTVNTPFPADFSLKSAGNKPPAAKPRPAVNTTIPRPAPARPSANMAAPTPAQPRPAVHKPAAEVTATAMRTHAPHNVIEPTRAPSVASVNTVSTPEPDFKIETNTWETGEHIEGVLKPVSERNAASKQGNVVCNMFTCVIGVWDKSAYSNDLYQIYLDMTQKNRPGVIMNNTMENPTPREIGEIKRSNTLSMDNTIMELAGQITYPMNTDLQTALRSAFVKTIKQAAAEPDISPGKLTTRAIYVLCWLRRYMEDLFGKERWNIKKQPGCFIKMGKCSHNEMLFLSFLARLPVDVIILIPDKSVTLECNDPLLEIKEFPNSMQMSKYPDSPVQVRVDTIAYQAERELDTLMYQDSGIYRDMQYAKANAITLRTMYEEVAQLWVQEPKFRPNFKTSNGIVDIPVICTKISGVKDGNESAYWSEIKQMVTDDTIFVKGDSIPKKFCADNNIKNIAPKFFRNGKLAKDELINSQYFKYAYLRTDIINHMLDKLELLINSQIINGTLDGNGMEYTIIATILNLPQDVIQKIQSFDFTKKNPNLIYVNTSQTMMTLEESIVIAYLNLVGFDVACFIPTGYHNIEKFFSDPPFDEHQAGQYMYNLHVPNISPASKRPFGSLKRKLFGNK